MPKEKYEPPDPRRCYTIMSAEDAANGKKSYWAELEISGQSRLVSVDLFIVSDVRLFVGGGYLAVISLLKTCFANCFVMAF